MAGRAARANHQHKTKTNWRVFSELFFCFPSNGPSARPLPPPNTTHMWRRTLATLARDGPSLASFARARAPPPPPPRQPIPGVAAIVAVSSAKGGVGKSTVAGECVCVWRGERER